MDFLIIVALVILFGISIITSAFFTTRFYNNIADKRMRHITMYRAEELYREVLIFLLFVLIVFIIILLLIF